MSKEFKAPRPLQQIQADYQRLALKAGDMQYKIHVFEKDLATLNAQMQEINFEAVASQQAAAEEKAKAAAEEKKAKEAAAVGSEQPKQEVKADAQA